MTHLAAKPVKQMIAVVLAVCLSICCCQAQFLLHGLSGCDDGSSVAAADAAGACCDGCADEGPTEPQDDERPAPLKGCQVCCVKGTGLKDGGTLLTKAAAASLPAFALPAAITPPGPLRREVTPRVAEGRPHVQPRTLVRMHCALQV